MPGPVHPLPSPDVPGVRLLIHQDADGRWCAELDHDLAAVWEFNGATEQAQLASVRTLATQMVRGVGETQQSLPTVFSNVDVGEVVDVSENLFRTAQVLVYGTRPIFATRGLTETLMDALADAGEALLALL